MRETLQELLEDLGVGYILGPYQTQPWSHMDVEKGITCSAEVRMNPDGNELEAEIQIMYDAPPEGKPPVEQVLWLHAMPHKDNKWDVFHLKFYNQDKKNSIYGWESKCCKLFHACVNKINAGSIPNFDELMEEHFKEDERFGGRKGGGSGKSPKIRPAQLLDMKKGAGF